LIGPNGDITKAYNPGGPNDYQAFVRVQANPENIIRPAGVVTIV
jgi:hypothetical protein